MHERPESIDNTDLEKSDQKGLPQLETIHTSASQHPLELIESHRTISGVKWVLVCIALYVVCLIAIASITYSDK